MRKALQWTVSLLAVVAIFFGIVQYYVATGGRPSAAAGWVALSIALVIVVAANMLIEYRRRIAAKAGDISINAMAGAVRLSRKAKRGAASLKANVMERADRH